MKITITPRKLSGKIEAVSSKSDAHRKIICAALCDEPTEIFLRGVSEDINATLRCAEALGAKIERKKDCVVVSKGECPKKCTLLCGESGSTARFFMPIAAVLCDECVMKGEGRLPKRPFTTLSREMKKNGCDVSSSFLPIEMSGRLKSGEFTVEGNISSQFISGLMFALPNLSGNSKIILSTPLESAAYVDMTIRTLGEFGIKIKPADYGYYIEGNQKFISPKVLRCEGDWSNAAFFSAMKFAGCGLEVLGLDESSPQGDKVFLSAANCGRVDVSEIPDLVPPLAVAAASKNGETIFENAERLRLKESDRLVSVSQMINALGGEAEIVGDCLVVRGCGELKGGTVDSYSDHRIVMAAAAASVISKGEVEILGAEAVNKSYPSFFEDFKSLGGVFSVEC